MVPDQQLKFCGAHLRHAELPNVLVWHENCHDVGSVYHAQASCHHFVLAGEYACREDVLIARQRRNTRRRLRNIALSFHGWNSAVCVEQDRPATQFATKESARYMSGPTRAAKCMLKPLCQNYSDAPELGWTFPCQEMPNEIKEVTDANKGKVVLRSTSSIPSRSVSI